MNNYSLVRSKTFWTVVLMAVVGAGNAILPVIPTQYSAILVIILGGIASAFHLQTGQSQTGSN